MIVCVCNAITEDEVREVARCGVTCPANAYARLGCEPHCGCCLDYAQDIIDEEHRSRARCGASSAVAKRPNLHVIAA